MASCYADSNESLPMVQKVIDNDEVITAKSQQLQSSAPNTTKLGNKAKITANPMTLENIPPSKQESAQINMNNLSEIDNSSSNLLNLKRKLEIEKAEAELKKIRGIGTNNNNNNIAGLSSDNVQTTVTGVAINHEGKKIAWLQFADGGSLMVNIGSPVGKYIVNNITMSGVELISPVGKNRKSQTIFLKRAYYAPEKSKQNNNNSKLGFTPSPIVTSANTGDEMVPPIVPVR
jgi:hypothetical protein